MKHSSIFKNTVKVMIGSTVGIGAALLFLAYIGSFDFKYRILNHSTNEERFSEQDSIFYKRVKNKIRKVGDENDVDRIALIFATSQNLLEIQDYIRDMETLKANMLSESKEKVVFLVSYDEEVLLETKRSDESKGIKIETLLDRNSVLREHCRACGNGLVIIDVESGKVLWNMKLLPSPISVLENI